MGQESQANMYITYSRQVRSTDRSRWGRDAGIDDADLLMSGTFEKKATRLSLARSSASPLQLPGICLQ